MSAKEKLPQKQEPNTQVKYTTLADEGFTYITAEEFAKRLNVTSQNVRVQCHKGQIPGAVKIGKLWRIPVKKGSPC